MIATADRITIRCPYDGSPVAEIEQGTPETLERAIETADATKATMREMPAHARAEILEKLSGLLRRERDSVAHLLCLETGKPLKEALAETDRAVQTAIASAVAARTLCGEVIPMDAAPIGVGRMAMTVREPRGVIGIITPFNLPLNLALHKLGPALAAGNTVVHKPAEQTPLTAFRLAELLKEAGLPEGAYNVVPGPGETLGAHLVASPNVDMITFTGSVEVGKQIRAKAGLKAVTLELGGNSAVIVDRRADLETAVPRLVQGAFAHSGQVCISVQRIYAHADIADDLVAAMQKAIAALRLGPPQQPDTDVSSLIDEEAAERVCNVMEDASYRGARVVCGGERKRATITPAVLTDVPEDSTFMQDELFGPAVAVNTWTDLDAVIGHANSTRYGLQASIYTQDLDTAFYAAARLKAGGVLINDVPTFRADHMPYGGVKESGIGREGPQYAIQEMTETKLIAWKAR